jgi:hypothetical protein
MSPYGPGSRADFYNRRHIWQVVPTWDVRNAIIDVFKRFIRTEPGGSDLPTYSSLPRDLTGSDETAGALPFRIEGKMRRIKTLLGPKKEVSKDHHDATCRSVIIEM